MLFIQIPVELGRWEKSWLVPRPRVRCLLYRCCYHVKVRSYEYIHKYCSMGWMHIYSFIINLRLGHTDGWWEDVKKRTVVPGIVTDCKQKLTGVHGIGHLPYVTMPYNTECLYRKVYMRMANLWDKATGWLSSDMMIQGHNSLSVVDWYKYISKGLLDIVQEQRSNINI